MSGQPADVASAATARPSAARARIVAAADRLFYGQGIRAIGVDRVIAEAEVSRATFYRHFPSKDHLITEYLDRRLQDDQEELRRLRREHEADPRAVLVGIVAKLAEDTAAPGFRGCPYANLAAEFCDTGHPARDIAGEHRAWLLREVEALLADLGTPRADIVAEQLVMLRAGAMAVASVASTAQLTTAFTDAWTALIDQNS